MPSAAAAGCRSPRVTALAFRRIFLYILCIEQDAFDLGEGYRFSAPTAVPWEDGE
jgi:hypothetical protein